MENGGFDIVIGNPPYVQLSSNSGALAKMFENAKYKTFKATGDLYLLFYEKGWELLRSNGVLCFITSNSWLRATYGENARKFLADQANPTLLIDFAGQKIFESATVEVNILMFTKENNQQKTLACVVKDNVLNELSLIVRREGSICSFSSGNSWVILSDIEMRIKEKIERVGIPLKDWDVQINYGIKTGFNEAFIITGEQRKKLIAEDPKSAEIIRPILRGRDIKRYGYEFANQYLIATFPAKQYDIEDYLSIKNHLLTFGKDFLTKSGYTWVADGYLDEWCFKRLKQTGTEIIISGEKVSFKDNEKSRKAASGQWFETQDSISYWDDFNRQKIVWGEISDEPKFSIDLEGKYVNEPLL